MARRWLIDDRVHDGGSPIDGGGGPEAWPALISMVVLGGWLDLGKTTLLIQLLMAAGDGEFITGADLGRKEGGGPRVMTIHGLPGGFDPEATGVIFD
jgi:hypothetical protein